MAEIQGFPPKNTCQWQVISYLMHNGANSRIEIAKILNVTGATLSKVASALIKEGILCETGVIDEKRVGRRQMMIDLVRDYRFALGIDVSNTYLRVTLLDMKLQIREEHTWNYDMLTQLSLDTAIEFARSLMEKYGKEKILGIGLLVQGYVQDEISRSLPIRNIKEQIMDKIDIPVFITNNIRGLSITHSFLHEGSKNFVLVNYGPGVCSVIVENGKILKGYHNTAGEIGHIVWNPRVEKTCRICGQRGCLESMIHFDEIAHQAAAEYQGVNTDYETLMMASRRDQGKALRYALEQLAIAVNSVIVSIDPKELILSGQIFTNKKVFDYFANLLKQRGCPLTKENIHLISNYQEERLKSAGIVVFSECFEENLYDVD